MYVVLSDDHPFVLLGIDSSATACIVACMCRMICTSVKRGNLQTLGDVRGVLNDSTYIPNEPSELCNKLFVTCYMGTENSSVFTRDRAKSLANDIGSYHLGIFMEFLKSSFGIVFSNVLIMCTK